MTRGRFYCPCGLVLFDRDMKNSTSHSIWTILPFLLLFLFSCATTEQKQDELRNPRFYNNRGIAYAEKGQYDQAISDFNKAIEINPRDPQAYNSLAWLLATAKVPGFRNGEKAVALARKACELSEWKNPEYLDTLAASYARVGDFGNATRWEEKALQISEEGKKTESQKRLNLYREHRPWPPD
jgi:tetratricopeptide (TPR) repeat protein